VPHALAFVKGILVGIANIIPGVSGGTFALILGIYERLLRAIGSFGIGTLKLLSKWLIHPFRREERSALTAELQRADSFWLLMLLLGAGVAILGSSRLIGFLLDEHRAPTLAFFIGLIVPSILVPYGMLKRKGIKELISCVVAAGLLVCLSIFFKPGEGEGAGLLFLFVAGAVAISAMILPGVSGSFILMVMGEYRSVLDAINTWDFVRLAVFGAGCVLGILAFVRLLNFLLKRFHSVTMAFLIGLILGSLWVLWPFKEVAEGAKIITGVNVLPAAFGSEVTWAIGALLVGLVCSAGLHLLGKTMEKPAVPAGQAE
jgi:putative membrane protein